MLCLPVQVLSRLYGHVLLVMQHRHAPTRLARFCLDCLLFDLLFRRVFHPRCGHGVGANCFRCGCYGGKASDCKKKTNDIVLDSQRKMFNFIGIYQGKRLCSIRQCDVKLFTAYRNGPCSYSLYWNGTRLQQRG